MTKIVKYTQRPRFAKDKQRKYGPHRGSTPPGVRFNARGLSS